MNEILEDFGEVSWILQDREAALLQIALQLAYLKGKRDSCQEKTDSSSLSPSEQSSAMNHRIGELNLQIEELTDRFCHRMLDLK